MNNQQNTYDDSVFPKGFTFNGVSSKQLGFVVQTPPKYELPEKEYTVVHVPGRIGDVVINQGNYQNVERTYNIATIYTPEGNGKLNPETPVTNFVDKAEQLAAWLMSADGYCDLTDGYESQYIRKAMFKGGTEIEDIYGQGIAYELTFNCKPQRYFKGNGIYELKSYTLTNATRNASLVQPTYNQLLFKNIYAKPLIKIDGSSIKATTNTINLKIYRRDIVHTTNVLVNTITIDVSSMRSALTDLCDIYIDLENMIFNNSLDNPTINLSSYISFDNDITILEGSKLSYTLDDPDYYYINVTGNVQNTVPITSIYLASRWYRL